MDHDPTSPHAPTCPRISRLVLAALLLVPLSAPLAALHAAAAQKPTPFLPVSEPLFRPLGRA